jgi:hypothetical protein
MSTIHPFEPPRTLQQALSLLGEFLSAANMVDVLVALTFTFLALILLAHRLFWPILMRPTYFLADLGIARRSKELGIVGVVLLGYAGWGLPKIVEKVIETAG